MNAPSPAPWLLRQVCSRLGLRISWTEEAEKWVIAPPLGGAPVVSNPGPVAVPTHTAHSLRGVGVSAVAPTGGQGLVYDEGTGLWTPEALATNPLHTTVVTGTATAVGQVLTAMGAKAAGWAAPAAPYPRMDTGGTPYVLSSVYTGQIARVTMFADGRVRNLVFQMVLTVTAAIAGATIWIAFDATTSSGGNNLSIAGTAIGSHRLGRGAGTFIQLCHPGTHIRIYQTGKLTAGAATLQYSVAAL